MMLYVCRECGAEAGGVDVDLRFCIECGSDEIVLKSTTPMLPPPPPPPRPNNPHLRTPAPPPPPPPNNRGQPEPPEIVGYRCTYHSQAKGRIFTTVGGCPGHGPSWDCALEPLVVGPQKMRWVAGQGGWRVVG